MDAPYCPNCGFSGTQDSFKGWMLLLASLIPGAMATCSVVLVANTYGIPPSQNMRYEGDFIGAGFSVIVFAISLVILLLINQHYFADAYRRRIDLKSYLRPVAILGLFCLVWAVVLVRQAFGSYDSASGLIFAALSALVLSNIWVMIYYFRKDARRRSGK